MTGDIEKYGSGFLRIRKELKTYPTMRLEFGEIPNGFLVALHYKEQKISTQWWNEGLSEGLSEGLNKGLNEGLKSILEGIIKHPGIKAKDLPSILNSRPLKTVERQIKQLVEQKLIERQGSKKTGGYYYIKSS